MKSIFAIACLVLVSCSSNSGSDKVQYHYKLSQNNCVAEQSFDDKAAYCTALTDWKLNNGCASKLREDLYKKDCGGAFHQINMPGSAQTPPNTSAPAPVTGELKYEYGVLIREIDAQNRAALFIFAPNKIVQQITEVRAPEYLGKPQAEYGILDSDNLDKMFNFTSRPLPLTEKEILLKKFNGAVYLYLPQYQGSMCTDEVLNVSMGTVISGKPVKVIFSFSALPSQEGTCDFHTVSLMIFQ